MSVNISPNAILESQFPLKSSTQESTESRICGHDHLCVTVAIVSIPITVHLLNILILLFFSITATDLLEPEVRKAEKVLNIYKFGIILNYN